MISKMTFYICLKGIYSVFTFCRMRPPMAPPSQPSSMGVPPQMPQSSHLVGPAPSPLEFRIHEMNRRLYIFSNSGVVDSSIVCKNSMKPTCRFLKRTLPNGGTPSRMSSLTTTPEFGSFCWTIRRILRNMVKK